MVEPDAAPMILGSASPRRRAMLESLGLDFVVRSPEIDEDALLQADEPGGESLVARIARAKFDALRDTQDSGVLLTADTLVSCDGVLLGKPIDNEQVAAMLGQMAGRSAMISTGLCLGSIEHRAPVEPQIVNTWVRLKPLSDADIAAYVATGVGRDKAGALALQGEAGSFIEGVDGCWSNVLGLPLCAVVASLDLDGSGRGQHQRCSVELCGGFGISRW